ncbi:MAG: glucose-phosphate adenylyltransferase [Clostridiales bacterium]|nr:glucose-phosphate adenylyltransferase [Clostridiales bacterium]
MRKREVVAMILAGGQGSRLGVLTQNLAKPAVPFGGRYRIIDFTLSNCSNSGIYTVGVLTQYMPMELHTHIGVGSPWDLDRLNGGVFILPPHQKASGANWYQGTADAVYQNIPFIDAYEPNLVLVLSGDHIYKMDYNKMVAFHKDKGARCTIAVTDVPINEASRFGIMNTNDDLSIYEFEEKPRHPKSTKASMGIYVFDWQLLKEALIEDANKPESAHDFGKNVIPAILERGEKLYAYPFKGYWKDVGTVESLWEANMDLLGGNDDLDIGDPTWRVYSLAQARPAQYIGNAAKVQDSIVVDGCEIHGEVIHSVLSTNVKVERNAKIVDSVIMPDVYIGENAIVNKAIIGSNAIIRKNSVVGDGRNVTAIGLYEEVKAGMVAN